MNKNRWFLLLFALFSAILASVTSVADDLAGVMSVEAGTNGVVEFEMPFAPMEPIGPQGYVSGIFSGDGGEYSDRLFKYDSVSGLLTNAVWDGYSWFDPAIGLHSFMSASPGDILYFFRTDNEPFRFSVFGRLPSSFTSSSSPRFTSIGVNPTNETVNLVVSSNDRTFDVFSAESTYAASALSSEWTHLFRAPSAKFPALFSDSAPIPGNTKLFLASDAASDSDDDGLSDSMESYVYGTSLVNPDSDGDGLLDGQEIAWGLNPLIGEINSPSLWHEGFELPLVTPGSLSGQNGWTLSGDIKAVVTEQNSCKGNSSLSISGSFSSSSVDHDVTVDSDIVWIDMQLRNFFGKSGNCEMDSLSTVKFFATPQGYLVASDGAAMRTNNVLCVNDEEWIRFTLKLDYHTRRWDIYVNGVIALSNLHLFGDAKRIRGISFEDGSGDADEIRVLNHRPLGLSSDGDPMPDEWEHSSFGNLLRDGFGDFDGDGLSDAREFAAKTNPLRSDSDSDGIPDNWELERGLDPLDAADAALDPDGDGMSNQLEYELGIDPWFFEPNPSEVKSGLYAEFFHTRGEMQIVPDVSKLELLQTSIANTISYCDGTWPDKVEQKGDLFAARFSGFVKIAKSGTYNFYVTSDDGFKLSIGGKKIIQDIAPHSARETASSVFLEKGWQPIELLYYENKADAVLSLSWSGHGIPKALIPADCLCHIPPPPQAPPAGFSPGLVCSLYSLPGKITRMPDFSAVMPTQTSVVEDIDLPATTSSWPMAPESMTDRFAAIFEGAIYASGCGRYVFSLSSDDGSRLFIDGELLIDNDGNHSMTEKTAAIALSEGLHDIRVEYYENEGESGLKLSWGKEGDPVDIIHSGRFFHQSGIVDTDSDGMPDWWEEMYDLNSVNPDDAAYDLDGDGVVNLQEYLYGTNPRSSDTDSDAMPDGWEISNGLCPFANDAIADADNDGLVNVEEYRHGTNPMLADTDGDGCSDKMEIFNTRGNPLAKDILWTPVEASSSVAGSSFISSTGTWRTDEAGTVFAAERAGSLTWRLRIPEEGADALAVRIGQHNSYSKAFEFDLSLKVDGVFVARELVFAEYGSQEEVYFFLPEIPHGEYEFTVTWHNWEVNTFLSVFDLRFVKFRGPDSNGDGIADWKNYRFSNSSEMDALPCESLVSPLCVEGRDLWRDVLEIDVEYPETNAVYSTVKTICDGFYADIPLPLSGTAIVSMKDRTLSDSFPVVWKSFDVFTEEYATNALLIRAGDSLKIAPYQESESEITISIADSENNWRSVTNWTSSTAMPYCFATNGLYLVEVTRNEVFSSKSAYALVDVVSSRFPKRNPAILMDMPQTLTCPDLSPRNILEHDSELKLDTEILAKGVELSLFTSADRDLGMVSRLAEGGAISDAVQVTPIWADNGTYYRVAENYADGSQLIVVSLLFGAVAENMTIELEIFVSGVTFEDGSRFKTLTAKDLDENGHYTIRFIRARGVTTSVCHRTYIYQDGKLLYTNK